MAGHDCGPGDFPKRGLPVQRALIAGLAACALNVVDAHRVQIEASAIHLRHPAGCHAAAAALAAARCGGFHPIFAHAFQEPVNPCHAGNQKGEGDEKSEHGGTPEGYSETVMEAGENAQAPIQTREITGLTRGRSWATIARFPDGPG